MSCCPTCKFLCCKCLIVLSVCLVVVTVCLVVNLCLVALSVTGNCVCYCFTCPVVVFLIVLPVL